MLRFMKFSRKVTMRPFNRIPKVLLLASGLFPAAYAAAEDADTSRAVAAGQVSPAAAIPPFKSDIWLPLVSGVVPGSGQYIQGDWWGLPYSAAALGGVGLALHAKYESKEELGASTWDLLGENAWRERRFVLGNMAYQGAAFMSAYSTFRLSVPRFQEEDGKYKFMGPRKEDAGDLLMAPFKFNHLAKPTAWVPLGLLSAIAPFVIYHTRKDNRGANWTLSADDFAFASALSYNAGVSEEAAFRGWLYPVAYQYTGENYWLANGAQALLFSAMHYDKEDLPLPIPQLLMGFYWGWLTKRDKWSLSQSIFIHTWWDVLLLGTAIATNKAPEQTMRIGGSIPIPW